MIFSDKQESFTFIIDYHLSPTPFIFYPFIHLRDEVSRNPYLTQITLLASMLNNFFLVGLR